MPAPLLQRLGVALGLVRPSARDPLGPEGERVAARLLRGKGFRVIGANLRVPMGEADLLCVDPDGETVVLVEVKSRRVGGDDGAGVGTGEGTAAPGGSVAPPPEASITAHKRDKLAAILRHLARANGWTRRPLRIDVVAIEFPPAGEPTVRHHPGALRVEL